MLCRSSICATALAATLSMALAPASASDASKPPDLNGQWSRAHPRSQWDPSKPRGLAQQAPLTAEYQAIFEANLKSLHAGNLGADPQVFCLPTGMPRMMIAYEPMEVIVTPEVTYIRVDHLADFRRIYTDGRDWPSELKPTFDGYSIGKWMEPDGAGRYGVLEVETRGLKGPRTLDADGLPLHKDNRTVVKERISLDAANRDRLHDEITTVDHAFTRPWTVTRDYNREPHPLWPEFLCTEANNHVPIGNQFYFRGGDGFLMPAYKDQPPPDLRNFTPPR
ncbi:MAG TPA: hypothetical protein VIY51_04515 [Xanthobacteraceae bacterium]